MPARSRLRTTGEILNRVVLRAPVVPDRDAVAAKPEANLIFGDVLAEQVIQKQGSYAESCPKDVFRR